VERAASLEEFVAAPVGKFVATERCVGWCAGIDLFGAAAWDEPRADDVDFLAGLWDAVVPGRGAPIDKIFDVRFVTRIAEDTFARLVERARERVPVVREVRRQVLLAPAGLASAVTHGFWNLVPSRHPWHVATDDQEGFAWLGHPPALCAEVAAMLDEARDTRPPARLRRWLAAHLEGAELGVAAVALGTSARTLQRQLGEAGTSFREQLRAARLDVARRLLAEPDAKIEAVAAAVGCGSASSFTRMFRETHGETPAAWRDRVSAARRRE
jgi:AraC-like DNA-binding protein